MATRFINNHTVKQIVICCFIFFCSCQNNQWETIKSINNVYPKQDSMERIELTGFWGEKKIVERNLSLKDYPYKKYCENRITVEIDLSNKEMNEFVTYNYKTIPSTFLSESRKASITHYAGHTKDKNKLTLIFYSEDGMSLLHYDKIPCTFIYEKDTEWKAYQELLDSK
ncbi:MAG: hypothetical protein V4538_15965 [Bacteroidota bacterium]